MLKKAFLLVNHVEDGVHRLIVCDAFRVVASHDTFQRVRCHHFLLLHHLVVSYHVEHHVWRHH